MIAPHASRLPDELFHFHPRSTNPELWRTTVPLVVRARCKRHKGLIATWTAIHWLIVLHAASGRAHFGMREIAEEAGVGRNELAGPTGYIQRLVDLGLIRIVGSKAFRGLREPRPVYHIDLVELERLSLELVPDVLREHHIDRPPPAAPDPRQLRLALVPIDDDDALEATPPEEQLLADERGDIGREPGAPVSRPGRHEAGTAAYLQCWPDTRVMPHPARAEHQNGTGKTAGQPHSSVVTPDIGTELHQNGADSFSIRRGLLEHGQTAHVIGTVPARDRDMDRTNERTNEGVSQPFTPAFVQSLIAQTAQVVLATLQSQGNITTPDTPPALTNPPAAPIGAEPLSAPILTLWQGDQPALRRRDVHQLALLAAEYDGPTGGYGAYWLGRAILMADLCLGDREQPITVPYVRRVLKRWCEEGSWGSDRETGEPPLRAVGDPTIRPRPTVEPPHAEALRHPAVAAYVETLHETPNTVQAAQIAEIVTDLNVWRQVLTDWQLNGWGERSVGKMLDRYQKSFVPGGVAEVPPSVAVIHTYPGLTPEQRERWIRKFHAATTPAEKRAVISRLEQEHLR